MFLSREIDIKLYNICSVKQILFDKYATNLKTTISQRSLRNLVVLQLLIEFNNFSYSIDIINNIIYTSGPCHELALQPMECSIVKKKCASVCITCPVHCITIGGSSGQLIPPCRLHIYILV